ncbi:hypothetical protein [Aliarcobacter butzleri]|uniref:hypothetical protein n=1 Tax=Aliarcobacter butzleri TaxID=28197 RepID=UPI00126139AA|nr:hypothetical protein [Aliarcobacter butzleri]MCG3653311.1 hypothetical protein [Aliarcobacter butzleri]MCT7619137.1 hypothetical protein [Aliarcobacter butzleri]
MERINNFIKNNKTISVIIGFIGTVLIASISNGVWEYLLKPLLSFSINLILDLSTLGIESFKNSIYQSISKGFTEKASLLTFMYITFMIASFMMSSLFIIFSRYRRRLNKTKEKLNFKKNLLFLSIIIFSYFILTFIQNSQLLYINNAIIHYKQLISISTPYISEQELKVFNSRFSLIKNKNDYEKLINDLYIILEKNNLELKRINVW